jgi:hypothetical protein
MASSSMRRPGDRPSLFSNVAITSCCCLDFRSNRSEEGGATVDSGEMIVDVGVDVDADESREPVKVGETFREGDSSVSDTSRPASSAGARPDTTSAVVSLWWASLAAASAMT